MGVRCGLVMNACVSPGGAAIDLTRVKRSVHQKSVGNHIFSADCEYFGFLSLPVRGIGLTMAR